MKAENLSIESHHIAATNIALRNALRVIAVTSTEKNTRSIALDTLGESISKIQEEIHDYELFEIETNVPEDTPDEMHQFNFVRESNAKLLEALHEYETFEIELTLPGVQPK